jgi:Protein of unknown function (DUF3352)
VGRPSPGRIRGAAGSRLRGAFYVVEEVALSVGRFLARIPRALWGGIQGFWSGLSREGRGRLAAALGTAVLLIVILAAAVPNLPCEFPGGDSCPPADDALELVPSEAAFYAHVNLDRDSEQYERAADIAGRLPTITGEIARRAVALVPGPGGSPPSFARDIEPWLGDEAALATLPGGEGEFGSKLVLLQIGAPEGATRFAARVASGRPQVDTYREVEVSVDRRGLATAQLDGFLAIGTESVVRSVIDTQSGREGASALADDDDAQNARDELPDHRFADAYLSPAAARSLAAPNESLGQLSPLISPEATRGAAAALAADNDELELSVRSVLDTARVRSRPGFFSAFSPFDPTLAGELSTDALAYLGFGDPEGAVKALLAQASAAAPGIASGFEDLVEQLRQSDEIDISTDFLPTLGDEAAFALEPRLEGSESDPTPYLQFIADDVDAERAQRALASLQGPVADAVNPQTGVQAPVFEDTEIEGVDARTLGVSPAVELTYAVFDELATVATSPDGIARLASGDGGLDGTERFEQATEGLSDEPSLFGYFNLAELVAVGERLGLAEDPVYATFALEFRALESLGLAISTAEDALDTDARLTVRPPATDDDETGPPPPSD